MNLIMLGTGDFALPTFLRLLDSRHRVLRLVTQPDRPQGRKQELIPSRIKVAALDLGIPVFQPENVNSAEAIASIRNDAPDLLVTAAYGQILSPELLGVPQFGGINLHGSILPKYRGAAPVARAIQNGETEAGVTVIRMTPKIDAGGMLSIARTPIDPDETAGELEDRLAAIGAPKIVDAIDAIEGGTASFLPQSKSKVTRAPKLAKDDGRIDWTRSALQIHNLVRAMQPWPMASTHWIGSEVGKPPLRVIVHRTAPTEGQGEPGRVLEVDRDRLVVAAGEGAVQILVVQVPGKKLMPVAEFLKGQRVLTGDLMGDVP